MFPEPVPPYACVQATVRAGAQTAPWGLGLLAILLWAPSTLAAQRPCPQSPFPRITSEGTSPLVLVARLTGVILDREPPDEGARPYVNLQHAILTYQPLAELLGHREDGNHDFNGELPRLGGLDWTVGTTYLLVLVPLLDSIPAKRATYWTAACYGTQVVTGVDEAKRILAGARKP